MLLLNGVNDKIHQPQRAGIGMAVQLGGTLGRFTHRALQAARKVILSSPVKAQSTAGQVEIAPVTQANAALLQRGLDGIGNLVHLRFDNFRHLFLGEGQRLATLRRRNVVGIAGAGNAINILGA